MTMPARGPALSHHRVEAFSNGTRLKWRDRAERSHRSMRSGLWIGYHEFHYAPRQTSWSTMVMAEADDIALLLRKVHS